LLDYRNKGPGVQQALPTVEHFVPLLAAWGAAGGAANSVTFPIEGYTYGSFTKRSVQLA
jgi:4,5-DOPA dioxygenase extradiol